MLAWELTVENSLLNTDHSIFKSLTEYNPMGNIAKDMSKGIEETGVYIKKMTGVLTSKEMMFLDGFKESYFGEKEVHSQMFRLMYNSIGYRNDLRHFKGGNLTPKEIKGLHKQSKALIDSQSYLFSKVIESVVEELEKQRSESIYSMAGFMVSLVAYMLFVIMPVIHRTKQHIKRFLEFIKNNNILSNRLR